MAIFLEVLLDDRAELVGFRGDGVECLLGVMALLCLAVLMLLIVMLMYLMRRLYR
jgi:hypothetical protein